MTEFRIINADVLDGLRQLPDESVHCCVTSPPYWGLRDYGTGQWVGGLPDCDHTYNHGVQGSTGQRADRTFTGQAVYKHECGKCGAVRVDQQIGIERTYQEYVERLVGVFREVRRVLRADGTLFLNLGDSYATGAGKVGDCPGGGEQGERWKTGYRGNHADDPKRATMAAAIGPMTQANRMPQPGLKPKDLVGIPWRVAFALQADGWWLRQWAPWIKRNGMPESTKDRPTTSCETVFLLSKSERYFYDYETVKKPVKPDTVDRYGRGRSDDHKWADGGPGGQTIARTFDHMKQDGHGRRHAGFNDREFAQEPRETRARRNTDWFIESLDGMLTNDDGDPLAFCVNTSPFKGAHFAVMPEALVEPCILAGCPVGGTALDPFTGSGTTAVVALRHGRNFVGCELSAEYAAMARRRILADAPLLNREAIA